MSGLFGSTTIKGTRMTDFSGTSAEVGKPIPFGHGSYPADGIINWAPLPPVEHRKVKRQGKGGVKTETFTYTLSYGVMFCKGVIYGYRWIKRQGKVVYTTDPNAPLEDLEYAAKWASRVSFHNGTLDQLPDSLIESYEGVGNVSGFPYIAYFTVEDEDTTDNGGAPPNYEACVIASPPEAYLTSHPYPIFDQSQANYSATLDGGLLRLILHETSSFEEATYSAALDSGELREPLLTALQEPARATYLAVLSGGEMRAPIVYASQQPSRATYSAELVDGILRVALISTGIQPSQATYSAALTGGTLA